MEPLPCSWHSRESLSLLITVLYGDSRSRACRGVGEKGRVSKYLKTAESGVHRKPHGCKHNIWDIQYLRAGSHVGSLVLCGKGSLASRLAGKFCVLGWNHPRVLLVRGKGSSFPSCSVGSAWLGAVGAAAGTPGRWISFVPEPGSCQGSAAGARCIPSPMAGAGGINL